MRYEGAEKARVNYDEQVIITLVGGSDGITRKSWFFDDKLCHVTVPVLKPRRASLLS